MHAAPSRSSENARVAHALNRLVYVCVDAAGGYALAAGHVKDPELRALFWRWAEERAAFVRDLQVEVDALREHAATEGTALADLHRTFMTVHHALAHPLDDVVVRACLFGDEHAEKAYRHAIETTIWTGRGGAHATVTAQHAEVALACDELRRRLVP